MCCPFVEFLSDRRQRVVVNGAASEWIPIISVLPQRSLLGSLLFILNASEICELVENRLFAYADDSTLLAVVASKQTDLLLLPPLTGTCFRIQEWCNHWCMILDPNKTKALVVSRSRTVSSPHGDLVLSGVSIRASPILDILGLKFVCKLTFEDLVRGVVSSVSLRICFLRFVKRIFVDTSVLLRCYFTFVVPILEYCSPV